MSTNALSTSGGSGAGALANRGNGVTCLIRLDSPLDALSIERDLNPQLLAQAAALYRNGQLDAAADIYAPMLVHGSAGAMPFYMLGIIRAQQGRSEEALALVDGALRLDPDHPVILSARANILNTLRRPEEALASCNRALKAAPASVDVLIARGNILFGLARHQEALFSYDTALQHAPDFALAWNNRALTLRSLGRLDEALEACDRTIAIEPGNAEAFGNRGNTFQDLRRFDEALASHERALALAPGSAEAWSGRGLALLALNRLDEAPPCLGTEWARRRLVPRAQLRCCLAKL